LRSTISTNPGGATLGGTTSQAAVGGLATFNNLTLNKVANGYTLSASSGGLLGATSSPFNVLAGVCNSLTTGDWNVAARWDCARVPTPTDDVFVTGVHAVSIPAGFAATARNLAVNDGRRELRPPSRSRRIRHRSRRTTSTCISRATGITHSSWSTQGMQR
jgi:hypothetical protein